LTGRLLRYTSTVGMTKELPDGKYTSTNISKSLTKPGLKAGINFSNDIMTPAAQAFPEVLVETSYKDIQDPTKTAFQKGLRTPDPAFIYLQKDLKKLGDFVQWMTAQHEGLPTWLDVYPLLEDSKEFPSEKPLFVDVGGGIGHQCLALKTKFPQFDQPGRLVLQDLGPTIEHSIPMDNVNAMVHDFFTPQPIKGAKFYYMRNVLHDHPDDRCQIILKQTIAAMDKDSVILIDEMALQDVGIHWQAAQLDVFMMLSLGAMERTVTQWHNLLGSVGLKIVKIYTYTDLLKDSIIVAVPV